MHKRNRPPKAGAKLAVIVLSVALIACGVIGGTVAWLIDQTDSIENTFTYGDIEIDIVEPSGTQYKMLPGKTITKNPEILVRPGSEESWLFVKIDKSENFDEFMTYEVDAAWTALPGVDGVYYIEAADTLNATADTSYGVLKDDQVKVLDTVTKEQFAALTAETYPTLTFTGYAVQRDATIAAIDTAEEAWAIVSAPVAP